MIIAKASKKDNKQEILDLCRKGLQTRQDWDHKTCHDVMCRNPKRRVTCTLYSTMHHGMSCGLKSLCFFMLSLSKFQISNYSIMLTIHRNNN